MNRNIYIFFYISLLVFNIQGCTTQVNSDSSHTGPIATMTDKQDLIDKINKNIALANLEIEQMDWQKANLHIRSGLDTLGDRYFNPNILDDSGMNLVEADAQERDGKLEGATRQRLRILQRRFNLFKIKP